MRNEPDAGAADDRDGAVRDAVPGARGTRTELVRAIGRWSLTAAVINSVIGSGIFGLPSAIAALVGAWSPLAVLVAGCCVFVVVLCFAEVGSRFEDPGGPYLYTRAAFGPAVGFQVGWLHIWTRLLSGAAVLNVLADYLKLLVPAVGTPAGRAVALTAGVALVTAVNVIGVRQASWAVNVFTVAKLLPILLLVALGAFNLRQEVFATQIVAAPNWTEAVLLLVFAYGGFESAVLAAGETRDPKRDTAFALVVAMTVVTAVYCLVQFVVVGALPRAGSSAAPVAAALGELLGPAGLTVGSLAVVVSVYGWLTGFALMTPRLIFSMAGRRELPAFLSRVHPRFRTPHAAVLVNSAVTLGFGLYSNFAQAATLAAVSRLGIFGLTCAALIALRRRPGPAPGFRLPGGPVVALAGVAFSVWLISTRNLSQAWFLVALTAGGAVIWALARGRRGVRGEGRGAAEGEL